MTFNAKPKFKSYLRRVAESTSLRISTLRGVSRLFGCQAFFAMLFRLYTAFTRVLFACLCSAAESHLWLLVDSGTAFLPASVSCCDFAHRRKESASNLNLSNFANIHELFSNTTTQRPAKQFKHLKDITRR